MTTDKPTLLYSIKLVAAVTIFMTMGPISWASPALGSYSFDYRLQDTNLILKSASIFPAKSGHGYYAKGTYDTNGVELPWILKLSAGGAIEWSAVANDPQRKTFLMPDEADQLIVAHYDTNTDKTDLAKYDPSDLTTPLYTRELDGDRRFSSATMIFAGDGLYAASNLGDRVQVMKWLDAQTFAWTKEFITEKPDSTNPPAYEEVSTTSVRLDRLGAHLGVFWESAADDPTNSIITVAVLDPTDGSTLATHSDRTETGAAFMLGRAGVQVGDNTIYTGAQGLNGTTEFRITALTPFGEVVNAISVTNLNSTGLPRSDGHMGITLGSVPVGNNGGNEIVVMTFDENLQTLDGIQFGFGPGDVFRNSVTAWGFCFPNRLYMRGVALSVFGPRNDFDAYMNLDDLSHWFLERLDAVSLDLIGGIHFDLNSAPYSFFRHKNDNYVQLNLLNDRMGLGDERYVTNAPGGQVSAQGIAELNFLDHPIKHKPVELTEAQLAEARRITELSALEDARNPLLNGTQNPLPVSSDLWRSLPLSGAPSSEPVNPAEINQVTPDTVRITWIANEPTSVLILASPGAGGPFALQGQYWIDVGETLTKEFNPADSSLSEFFEVGPIYDPSAFSTVP